MIALTQVGRSTVIGLHTSRGKRAAIHASPETLA